MKQFNLAARAADSKPIEQFQIPTEFEKDAEGKLVPTKVETFDLYRPAGSSQLMVINLAARLHPGASDTTNMKAIAAAIDFLGSCMDTAQHKRLYELLVDPEYGMETDELMELCRWAMETVTARPTKRSTGSRGGRSTAGKKSTAAARRKA